jgi:hypothetical protein
MKKNYFLLLVLLFSYQFFTAQTSETFESEVNNAVTFSEGGVTFNITSQQSFFRVQGNYPNTGWNGSARDNKYLDNSNYTSATRGVQFTVATANAVAINLKSMWLYVSTSTLNLSPTGTVTIQGKRGTNTVFTVSQSNPFNPAAGVNNGFTLIDFTTFGGQNNSNAIIDSYVITTTDGIGYLSLDAMSFTCAPLTFTTGSQNVTCNGGNNGTATVTPANAEGLSYNWAPGDPAGDGTATATGLTAGEWTCTITNACGTSTTASFTITQPNALTANTTQSNVLCNGGTGSAIVTAAGGTGNYSYSWAPSGGNAATANNLLAGTYTVTVRDANNCSVTKDVIITQPSAAITSITSQTNVLCFGTATGTATVNATGGTGSYTYQWSPSGGTAATASNLSAGTYTVVIRDTNNCNISKTVTITQPGTLAANTTQTNVLCFGTATGGASVSVTGGSGIYSYQWSPSGGTAAIANNLSAGTYTVTVRDANNCSITKTVTITQPTELAATTSQINAVCFGDTGSASVSVTGGTGSYSYSWAPSGGTAATANNLSAGTYTVVIRDANNCSITRNVTITQPSAALTANTSQTNILCFGSATGTATVSTTGGTGSYTYQWSPSGGTAAAASNLSAGTYTVVIRDTNNCSITKTVTITQPGTLAATTTQTNVLCFGTATGGASVSVTGGSGSYSYQWSPSGGSAATANNLAAGTYTVTIRDANNCSIIKTVTITQPTELAATTSQINAACFGNTGIASVSVTGGTGSYSYQWSPSGGTGATATGLSAGTYTVVIRDANNCSITRNVTITQPSAALTASTSQIDASCANNYNGSATIVAAGGTGTYTYSWSPYGGNAATATALYGGDFTVTVTDSNNCSISKNVTITEPAFVDVTVQQTAATCTLPGNATVSVEGGSGSYTYSWSPTGGNQATATGLNPGYYSVTVTDTATGCIYSRELYLRGPEECTALTVWNGTAWSNGTPDCVSYAAEINGNYNTTLNGPITACTLTVNSGNVVVTTGYTITIKGVVTVAEAASLTINNNGALVQGDEYNANTGTITVQKDSNPLYRLDYTLWSSPVNGSQTLAEFSPETIAGRFYEYAAVNTNGIYRDAYVAVAPTSVFQTAKAYLIRMPNGTLTSTEYNAGTLAMPYTGTFTGTPNNGEITTPASVNGGRYTAIGNPYPSPINLASFFQGNRYVIDTQSGIYFWRKRNNSSSSTYATLTLAGFTANGANNGGAEQGTYFNGPNSNWLLSQGQGFFVKTQDEADYTQITFTNSMRRPASISGTQAFLRETQSAVPRLWLNLTNSSGIFSQTAVAYIDTATTGIDYGYDGAVFNDGSTALYSIAAGSELAIQARPAFNVNDVVTMGFNTLAAGEYTISLDHFEGQFSQDQDIYLKDNLTGMVHDLKESDYTFTTNAGIMNIRFEIVYTNEALSKPEPILNANSVMVYKDNKAIHVNAGSVEITGVVIYDIRGRKLYSKSAVNAVQTEITDLQAESQVLIVEITTTKGRVSKRIIF